MQRSRGEVQFQHLCVGRNNDDALETTAVILADCSCLPKSSNKHFGTHLTAIVQHDGDHVAAADAFAAQERRQARGTTEQLQVGQRRVARGRHVDHREAARVVSRRPHEDVPGAPGERHGDEVSCCGARRCST